MDHEAEFIDAVLAMLEFGAKGRYTEKEIRAEIERRGFHQFGLHVFGTHGIFEISGDGKMRLNINGLNLLMTHRSIEQAKRHATFAIWVGVIACIINAASLAVVVCQTWRG